jgi:alpha-galactosidase
MRLTGSGPVLGLSTLVVPLVAAVAATLLGCGSSSSGGAPATDGGADGTGSTGQPDGGEDAPGAEVGADTGVADSETGTVVPDAGAVDSESGTGAPDTGAADSGGGGQEPEGGTGTPDAGGDGGAGLLGGKPSMGWESWWSTHTCNPSEAEVEAIADVMVSKFQSFGYEYILIDDCWYSGFDEYGRWKPNTNEFPNGWSAAAAYVHSKGLKIGVYLTPGVNDTVVTANSPVYGANGVTTYHAQDIVTSGAGNTDKASGATTKKLDFTKPGAVDFVQGYANLVAGWGADAVKMDFVGPGGGGGTCDNQDDIMQWRAALNNTGRQIELNLSNQLDISAISTWQKYSNSWRVSTDIECYCSTDTNWTHVAREIFGLGTTRGLLNPNFVPYAGPGHWNDLDSLMIGEGTFDGITTDERQTQFSFWAMVGSPLIIGSDLTKLDAGDYAILTNSEVIAVNQSGIPAKPVSTASNQQVWYSKQADGSIAVGLFNFDATSAQVTAKFSDVGASSTMSVHDMVSHTDLGQSSTSFSATLPEHGSRMLKLTQ